MNQTYYEILNRFSFFIRKASREMMPKNWVLHRRMILDHELLYVDQGEIVCDIDKAKYTVCENEILLLPPKMPHRFVTCKKNLIQLHIHFDFFYDALSEQRFITFGMMDENDPAYPLMTEDIFAALNIPYHIVLDASARQTVKKIMKDIVNLQLSNEITSVLTVKRYMLEIFELILLQYLPENERSSKEDALFRMVNILIEHRVNTDLKWDMLASEMGYSANYLSSLYKSRYGITPAQQHSRMKMERAKSYLIGQNLTITEISNILGFDSIADFSRYFKRATGFAPMHFKSANKKS